MSFLERRLSRLHHLSDETISRLLSGESSALQRVRAQGHLANCWQCRLRSDALNRAAMQVAGYRKNLAEATPANLQRRRILLAELRRRAEKTEPQPAWSRSILYLCQRVVNQMSPVLASVAIVVSATILLIWVWHRPATSVTASQVLDRAEIAEKAVSKGKAGVVYQRVSITTPHRRIEHEIYRDVRSVRRRRPEPLKTETEPIRQVMSSVGVDWQAPLSAASYREWHDRQSSVSDEVRKTGGDLLTLISKVPNGQIQQQSLTVRTSDFHPVGRTIEVGAYGTIEIAELSYAVLGWSGVNEALFEPLADQPPVHPVVLPNLPSAMELDSAELSARLVLNRMHADEGEQISISRSHRAVQVKGIVDTEERKREIVSKFSGLPHVTADVLSIAELQNLPRNESAAQPIQVQSIKSQPSPLETFLDAEGSRRTELGDISQRLLQAALKVQQSARELIALRKRFPALNDSSGKDPALSELTQSYKERLLAGLDTEVSALDALRVIQRQEQPPGTATIDLAAETDRNEALCRELIVGSAGATRQISEIVPELYQSIARIRSAIGTSSPTSTK
jgi:hypothetical protein